MAASRWDRTVDFNLGVRLGSECELNKSDSEYWVQHSARPIASSLERKIKHSAVEGRDDLLWEA